MRRKADGKAGCLKGENLRDYLCSHNAKNPVISRGYIFRHMKMKERKSTRERIGKGQRIDVQNRDRSERLTGNFRWAFSYAVERRPQKGREEKTTR